MYNTTETVKRGTVVQHQSLFFKSSITDRRAFNITHRVYNITRRAHNISLAESTARVGVSIRTRPARLAYLDVEADLPVAHGGHEGEVVDVRVLVEVVRADDGDVELAGQVGDLLVPAPLVRQELVDQSRVRPRVQDLLRVDARQRGPDHVAHVVHAALRNDRE
eukprot:1194369-Prorocentrum_minimum.AAC.2